uniref:Uncharacterized protein n=1 Tax=Athene cunicularia TaxID=194338 RepID=A0A663LZM7_ATHCN
MFSAGVADFYCQIMSKICLYNCLHGSSMHATGYGELWMGWDTTSELYQFGCTCTSNKNDYSAKTVMGDWNEERCDIQRTVQPKALPSQREPTGFQATTLRWNLLRSTQQLSPATQ